MALKSLLVTVNRLVGIAALGSTDLILGNDGTGSNTGVRVYQAKMGSRRLWRD